MSLQSIARSECPRELEPVDRNIRVHVDLVKRDDNYIVTLIPCSHYNTLYSTCQGFLFCISRHAGATKAEKLIPRCGKNPRSQRIRISCSRATSSIRANEHRASTISRASCGPSSTNNLDPAKVGRRDTPCIQVQQPPHGERRAWVHRRFETWWLQRVPVANHGVPS